MPRIDKVAVVFGFLAVTTFFVRAMAQDGPADDRPGGPPSPAGGFHLLPRSVVDRLNLTADQNRQIDDLERETRAKLDKILTPRQKKLLSDSRPPRPERPAPFDGPNPIDDRMPKPEEVTPPADDFPSPPTFESAAPVDVLPPGVTRVPVDFSGGHETDPRDRGRPVVLIAAALGVKPEVFREAFSHVQPAPAGTEPQPDQVRRNKVVLMRALGKYGVTNERLDAVSNYYRYVRSRDEHWPEKAAVANALVKNGAVTGFEIIHGGSGYSSPPTVKVPGVAGASAKVELSFGKVLAGNGAVSSITLAK